MRFDRGIFGAQIFQVLRRPVRPEAQQFFLIDILRGLAAFAIIVFHYKNFFLGSARQGLAMGDLDQIPFFQALSFLRYHGSAAVMLFWMISGFVMALVYSGHGRQIDARAYTANRLSRLYPLHFLTLMYLLVLQSASFHLFGQGQIYHNTDPYHFVLQVFFVSAFGFEEGLSFNGPIWSVSAEVFAYAVFFLFVRFVPVTLISTVIALMLSIVGYGVYPSVLLLCLVYFFGGMIVFILFDLCKLWPGRALVGVVLVFVLCAALDWLMVQVGVALPDTIRLLGAFGALLVILALWETRFPFQRVYARFRAIGDITYSTYLLHTPVQATFLFCVALGWVNLSVVFEPVFAITYALFLCVLAYIVFLKVEMPAKRWVRSKLLRSPHETGKP